MYRLRNYYLRCLSVTQYVPLHTATKISDSPQTSARTIARNLNSDCYKTSKKEGSLTFKLVAQQINNLLIICEVGDGLLSDSETRLLKNILRSLGICTDILNFEVVEFLNIPNALDEKFLTSVFNQFSEKPDITLGLILGLKNHWRIPVVMDLSDNSVNRFELPNGIKIALISDLATMLSEPEEKKRAWNVLRSRPEIGQTAFNRHQ